MEGRASRACAPHFHLQPRAALLPPRLVVRPARPVVQQTCQARSSRGAQEEASAGAGQPKEPAAQSKQESFSKLAADVAVNPLTYLAAIGLCVALVNAFGDSDATLLLLAAFPVVGLTALSKSSAGQAVADNLQEQLPGALVPCIAVV